MSTYGLAIAHRRKSLGLTQEELADKLGSHQTYISRVERGERSPTRGFIDKLHNGLELVGPQRDRFDGLYVRQSDVEPEENEESSRLVRLDIIYRDSKEEDRRKIEEAVERLLEELGRTDD